MNLDIFFGIRPIISNYVFDFPIFYGCTIFAWRYLEKLSEYIKANYKKVMLCHFSFELHGVLQK